MAARLDLVHGQVFGLGDCDTAAPMDRFNGGDQEVAAIATYWRNELNAFINMGGGRFFVGLTQDGRVEGVYCGDSKAKDGLRLLVDNSLGRFYPQVDFAGSGVKLEFIAVLHPETHSPLPRRFVLLVSLTVRLEEVGVYFVDRERREAYFRSTSALQRMDPGIIDDKIKRANVVRVQRGLPPLVRSQSGPASVPRAPGPPPSTVGKLAVGAPLLRAPPVTPSPRLQQLPRVPSVPTHPNPTKRQRLEPQKGLDTQNTKTLLTQAPFFQSVISEKTPGESPQHCDAIVGKRPPKEVLPEVEETETSLQAWVARLQKLRNNRRGKWDVDIAALERLMRRVTYNPDLHTQGITQRLQEIEALLQEVSPAKAKPTPPIFPPNLEPLLNQIPELKVLMRIIGPASTAERCRQIHEEVEVTVQKNIKNLGGLLKPTQHDISSVEILQVAEAQLRQTALANVRARVVNELRLLQLVHS
eukprot:TRINITY_DN3330_c0_g1_i1.p1 TRINITY_DN3330_c0_g1~~TRINITY_DN3330_c0_g1_i1.p1  ORF type:complete len:471 (-),score=61.68 TRINITY_DN3330_c0_g1_i1:50-1462(-)